MATGKIEVYAKGGTHKVLTYFTEDDVQIGDRVKILGGILRGQYGYVYGLTSDYSGYLFEVEKAPGLDQKQLARKIEDLSQKIANVADELYDLSCEVYE
jgi:hypothetical protein